MIHNAANHLITLRGASPLRLFRRAGPYTQCGYDLRGGYRREFPVAEPPTQVARLRSGDPAALAEVVGRYQHRLYRYFVRLVRDQASADDLFQQTWLQVVRHLAPLRCVAEFRYVAVRHRAQCGDGSVAPAPSESRWRIGELALAVTGAGCAQRGARRRARRDSGRGDGRAARAVPRGAHAALRRRHEAGGDRRGDGHAALHGKEPGAARAGSPANRDFRRKIFYERSRICPRTARAERGRPAGCRRERRLREHAARVC